MRAISLILSAIVFALAPASPALASLICAANNVTLNYGQYDVLAGSVLDAVGTIQVTCTKNSSAGGSYNNNGTVTYSVALTPLTPRQLVQIGGSDLLTHQLYIDSARTKPWGDGTGGTFVFNDSVSVNRNTTVADKVINIYARITAGQNVGGNSSIPNYVQSNFTVTVTCTTPATSC